MAPGLSLASRGRGMKLFTLCSIGLALTFAPAEALRIATWNITVYPSNLTVRQDDFRTVMAAMDPDVLVVQELTTQAGRDSFYFNVLKNVSPARVWKQSSFIATTESAVFWDSLKVTVLNVVSFATAGPRDVLRFRVRPVGYASNTASALVYSLHLKAGNTAPDEATRQAECTDIRNQLNFDGDNGNHLLVGGDYNAYDSSDLGYVRLLESQVDNDGRLKDPINTAGSWTANPAFAAVHTQSPCSNPGTDCPSNFSGGGMDDRFDFMLHTYSFEDGEGLDFVPGGYVNYGNDGQHYNQPINGSGFNNAVGIAIANAINDCADHLPIIYTFQVPAKIAATSQLDFGSVIVNGTNTKNLLVSNPAIAPADELTYSLSAPAGFFAPGGAHNVSAGAPANVHGIDIDSSTPAQLNGTLTVSTDDPDSLTKGVLLSGTILSHAVSSLDSSTIELAELVDFGDHPIGGFTDQMTRVHNQGYDALQARLSVEDAVIGGGDGRFSIVGGFSPSLVAGVGNTYDLHFDDTGATLDQTYTATLTFTGNDEPLPGASAASDLVVSLRARPLSGGVDVPGDRIPTVVAFYPPRPNPLRDRVQLGFDLPRSAPVSLEILDLAGRRVATVAGGNWEPGRYTPTWNARQEDGTRAPAGLYFVRFSTPGLVRVARLVLLP